MTDADQKPAAAGQVERPVRPGAEAYNLTDNEIADMAFAVLRAHNDDKLWRALTYSAGQYEVTMPTVALCHLARVFFAAGIATAERVAKQPLTWQQAVQKHITDPVVQGRILSVPNDATPEQALAVIRGA